MRISPEHIPVDFEFHESWWHKNFGINFNKWYYFDADYRVKIDREMRKFLYEKYGYLGLGEKDPEPQPIIDFGCVTLPALFGCEVVFSPDSSSFAGNLELSKEKIERLKIPDIKNSFPLKQITQQMDYLEKKYGFVCGDLDWDGCLNMGLHLRGYHLFEDFYDNPFLVYKVLTIATGTMIKVVNYIKGRTGTSSTAVTPIIADVNPELNVTSNCTVTMISEEQYKKFIFEHDKFLAKKLPPFGVHHCGSDAERFAPIYAQLESLKFFEAGWGSNIKECRKILGPSMHLNARLSPVRLKECPKGEIIQDTTELIDQGSPLQTFSISVMGIEFDIPDENIEGVVETVQKLGIISKNLD